MFLRIILIVVHDGTSDLSSEMILVVAHHCHVVHKYSLNMGQVLHGATPGVVSWATNHEGTHLFT